MKDYRLREMVFPPDELSRYPELLQELLVSRGIETSQEAEIFLGPRFERDTHDPFLLLGMERAVERILAAIRAQEHIVIYSDYDHDGVPGGSLLHDLFKKIGVGSFENYIPHRSDEGFGINTPALDALAARGAKLLITVDLGTTQVDEIAYANRLGIDVIVTDHHLPPVALPDAYAIINPKQEGDTYPFKELCGAGVAFKLAQGIIKRGIETKQFALVPGWEKWLLDLVAIATVGDMVPLVGENRAFVHFGLQVLRKTRRPGLLSIFEKTRMNQRFLSEDDVGFMVVPRVNAASRIGEPRDAFRLLTTADADEAREVSEKLEEMNTERKVMGAVMIKEMKKRLEKTSEIREVIVMGSPKWKPSVLGIAASTLASEYHRPVFLWGRERETRLKGSCRSDGSVSVVELMEKVEHLFIDYGGHHASGGFSIEQEHITSMEEGLISAYPALQNGNSNRIVPIDKKISLDEVTWQTYGAIEQLAPFGIGNGKPLFLLESVVVQGVEHFGKGKDHLKLIFHRSDGSEVSAIAFFMKADTYPGLEAGKHVTLIANLEKSMFMRKPELRLRIIDILPPHLLFS